MNYTREDGGEETEHVDREIRERRKIEKLFIENRKERGEGKRERKREGEKRDEIEERKRKKKDGTLSVKKGERSRLKGEEKIERKKERDEKADEVQGYRA